MAYVIVFVLLVAVVIVIVSPLRRGKGGASIGKGGEDAGGAELPSATEQERIELEAAREAKLREIRDAELDHQTGKLSDQDYQAIDSQLRGEAIEILSRIDQLDGLAPPQPEHRLPADDAPGEGGSADEQSAQ